MYYNELMEFGAHEDFRDFIIGMTEDVLRTEYYTWPLCQDHESVKIR